MADSGTNGFVPCQCEHVAHFDLAQRTPNGNPGHGYGSEFHPHVMQVVETISGKFTICPDCAKDCLPPDSKYRKRPEPRL